ncbi:acyltransferase family protein [Shewanella violacea]|uniref:Acyltransferase family protein n=1 Tax=Shewanella violacea (strain JCM 10179 / CIP 106290 / LMG 19151 / DSS12) TaxID=637905 RepID=D4ZIF9_SHEVD|nr:acyltransferase [Shewanella violacea]BAJ01458.1 acyltransferase family protein [Shewanella violacea DSS12]
MKFRNDINGLRAIAVLPVIFFHAGVIGFNGGFLGVDVFFVISGFLITANIIKSQKSDSFSLLSFYDKRARRILPPLILTLLITTVFSFVFMLPYDLKNFGQSLVSTSFAANNILLYLTSGYWSLASEFKPLYHTWSLAVEEQYYFILPIIFILLLKKQKCLKVTVILFFIISFLSSYLIENKEFNFLMIITRFWELCAGSLLAMYMKERVTTKNDAMSIIGLFFILYSYYNPYILSNNSAIINLAPVLGTLMVIAFTKPNSIIYKILSTKLIIIIGLSSYSIYLLHQPILSFIRLATEGQVGSYKQLMWALLSIPLGYLSWRFVESPFRNKKVVSNKVFYSLIALCFMSFISLGLFLNKSYGMQQYYVFSKYSYGVNPQAYADRPYSLAKHNFESDGQKMLIIGNSFARDIYNALKENDATDGYEVIYLANYNNDISLSRNLLSHADVTILVSSSGMANKIIAPSTLKASAIESKNEMDKYSNGNYYYVGTKNFGFNNNFIKQINWDSSKNYMVEINKSNIYADKIESNIFADNYINLLELFREKNKTRIFTDDHRFISFDTDHITKDGALFLGKRILKTTKLKNIIL